MVHTWLDAGVIFYAEFRLGFEKDEVGRSDKDFGERATMSAFIGSKSDKF